MITTNKWVSIGNGIFCTVLLAFGISLFFIRTTRIAHVYETDPEIRATPSSTAFINGQYLILPHKSHLGELDKILSSLDLVPVLPILDWILVQKKSVTEFPVVELSTPRAEEATQMINTLLEHPFILDAELNFHLSPAAFKDSTLAWPFVSATENASSLQLDKAWQISSGSNNVTIAVIDDFIENNIFHFQARFKNCTSRISLKTPFGSSHKDLFFNSHADLMLLALGACNTIDGLSSGIDSHASLWAVERSTQGHAQTMAAALYAAGVDICKDSVIRCPKMPSYSPPTKAADVIVLPFAHSAPELLQFFSDTLASIEPSKTIVVASAGNDSKQAHSYFPGNIANVINVGAFNQAGEKSSFSNWGPSVDIHAAGENIPFIFPPMTKIASGTSLSAAWSAGTIALMKAVNPQLSYKRALAFMQQGAQAFSCKDYCAPLTFNNSQECPSLCCAHPDNDCGLFKLNTFNAVRLAQINHCDEGLLEINKSYILFTRNMMMPQSIIIKNVGDKAAEVETLFYDKNILVEPASFTLSPLNSANDTQTIYLSFHKEPYKRQVSKIELVVRNKNNKTDKNEVFIEYIPKS